MRLSSRVRVLVEADLRSYRVACQEVAWLREREADLTAPTTAVLSHIGSATGQPGDPTYRRGVALARESGRAARAVALVERLDAWRPTLHRDDRLLLSLLYSMDREEGCTLDDACLALGIPHATRDEQRWVAEHLRDLLVQAAGALGHREQGRSQAWEVGAVALVG